MIDSFQNNKGSLKNNDLLSYFLLTTLLYNSKKPQHKLPHNHQINTPNQYQPHPHQHNNQQTKKL